METGKTLGVVLLLAAVVVGALSVFTVKQWELAIKLQFGRIVATDYDPGLHFMIPILNTIKRFDGRIMTLDAEPERYLTLEKKNVIVDSFVKWRISDVKTFYTAVGGSLDLANLRLSQVTRDLLRSEFGKRTVQEVVSGERSEIMKNVLLNSTREAQKFGITVVDARVKRIDWPEDVSASVYDRMSAERKRVANDFRSRGAEEAEKIRANADRKRTVILAEAYRQAEEIRGAGDAKAAEIYAKAFKRDPEFYAFYRSLSAYRSTFKDGGSLLVLEPDSEFFQYFKRLESPRP